MSHLSPNSGSKLVAGTQKDIEVLDKGNLQTLKRKAPPPFLGSEPSSKMRNVWNTKEEIINTRDFYGTASSRSMKVVPFDHASVRPNLDQKHSFAMDSALKIKANLSPEFPSFVKIMLLGHVTCGFTMNLPKKFTDLHLPQHDETVILVDENELEYKTKYLARKSGLSGGWRTFSIEHKLQEKDVLVFHLIQQCKFKVYIVRNNSSAESDVVIGSQNNGSLRVQMDNEEKQSEITKMAREKTLEGYVHSVPDKDTSALSKDVNAAEDRYGMPTDNCGPENLVGIRFSESVDFKYVKSFENFNIVVDGMIIDCEIPQHLRVKYYELCRSQESYLHDQLINGLNLQLVVGFISETINIADAIRSFKPTSCCENLIIWDKTLKAFEDLGMKVGFLRARINKLLALSFDSQGALKFKILEKVKAEEEFKALSIKLSSTKEMIDKLDSEIEVMKKKGEILQDVYMEEAKEPC